MPSACGKNERVEFRKKQLNPLEARAETQKSRLSASLRTVQLGDRRDAQLIRRQINPLSATYRAMAELDAPDEAQDEHEAYNKANAAFVASLRRFADELARGNERRLSRAGRRAQEAIGASRRAEQDMDQAVAK